MKTEKPKENDVDKVNKIYFGLTPEQRVLMKGLVLLDIGMSYLEIDHNVTLEKKEVKK